MSSNAKSNKRVFRVHASMIGGIDFMYSSLACMTQIDPEKLLVIPSHE